MSEMLHARDCCLKAIRFWAVCAETPCPCTSVTVVNEEDAPLPVFWSGIPCDSRMEVAARVDDVTHGTVYIARIFNDTDGLKNYEYTVDNEGGAGPDQYVWQVAEALAALINANSADFDTPITATGYRDGFVKLNAGETPIRADFLKAPVGEGVVAMTDQAWRWPTPEVGAGCVILGGTGTYDEETSGGVSRVSNFSGFGCWGNSPGILPPCVDMPFKSAISGKAVLVIDNKQYVWRAKVTTKTRGYNYTVGGVTYTTIPDDESGTLGDVAQKIADLFNGLSTDYTATVRDNWVEIHHNTGWRGFGNDGTRFRISLSGYSPQIEEWYVFPNTYYGKEMTGWDELAGPSVALNATLADRELGYEAFNYPALSTAQRDEEMAEEWADAFNTWVSGTPEFKGFRDVTATRMYWGAQQTGTITATTDPGPIVAAKLAVDATAPPNGSRIVIDSGTGAGQISTVTGHLFVGPDRIVYFWPPMADGLDTDSVYRIYQHVGVKLESTNPNHAGDPRGERPNEGIHAGKHSLLFWATNGNGTSDDTQRANAWADAGIVLRCCGPRDGDVYQIRFAGSSPSAFDVTATVTVDNPPNESGCGGQGPDSTPEAIADKWVAEFNSVASGIPADVRPTATHAGNGTIVIEGNVYDSDPEIAAPFNFASPTILSAWSAFQIIQSPANGVLESDAVWYWGGAGLVEIPYRPFVGWPYSGSSTEWHAANIATATIVGPEYAGDLNCFEEPPPDSACPGKCHNDCLSLDATVRITGSVIWRATVEADPCEVEVLDTATFDTGHRPLFSGCTPIDVSHLQGANIGFPDCEVGVQIGVNGPVCPTYGSFQITRTEVAAGGAPPCNTNLVSQRFATVFYDEESGTWKGGLLNGEVWEPYGNLCDGQPEIIVNATVTFTSSGQWHLGTDPDCEATYQRCLPGAENPLP